MGYLLDQRNYREIQGVAGGGLKGADAPFAKDDMGVSLCKDVFGSGEELLQSGAHPPFQEDRFLYPPDFTEQIEVLHVPCANLEQIRGFCHQTNSIRAHDFGHYGKPRLFACLHKKFEPLLAQSLKGMRTGARFEGSAAQKVGSCFFYRPRRHEYLSFTLHSTGACDYNRPLSLADFDTADFNYRVFRMKITRHKFIGFRNMDDLHYPRQVANGGVIDVPLVTEDADGGPLAPRDRGGSQPHCFYSFGDGLDLFVAGFVVHDYEHGEFSCQEFSATIAGNSILVKSSHRLRFAFLLQSSRMRAKRSLPCASGKNRSSGWERRYSTILSLPKRLYSRGRGALPLPR